MPLVQTRFEERSGVVSPDGQWLAYASDRSGRLEIWVQSFPEAGGQSQVSTLGGTAPQWARNGKELFYMGLGRGADGGRHRGKPWVVEGADTDKATRASVLLHRLRWRWPIL